MTRNLKAFGLALMAALALGAVAASAASAVSHHFNGTVGNKLSSAALNVQVFEWTTGEGKGYQCKKAEVAAGEVTEATVTSVTKEPKFSECESFGPIAPAKIETDSCHFTFTGVTTPGNPTGGEHANVHVKCTVPGEEITIRVTALNIKCIAIPEQELKHAVRYENETTAGDGKTHVKVIATAHGIRSTTIGSCGAGEEHTNGSYTGNVTTTAPNGISINNT